jgi:hypothetical protein
LQTLDLKDVAFAGCAAFAVKACAFPEMRREAFINADQRK